MSHHLQVDGSYKLKPCLKPWHGGIFRASDRALLQGSTGERTRTMARDRTARSCFHRDRACVNAFRHIPFNATAQPRPTARAHDTFQLKPTPHAVQRESLPEDNFYIVSVWQTDDWFFCGFLALSPSEVTLPGTSPSCLPECRARPSSLIYTHCRASWDCHFNCLQKPSPWAK
ncbi:hypothetical protein DPEC_G00345510 [Dallia pectoralis]|uniref:Uncharacterized protein n=1 Tax=Dallia pectoralis TaxID=75939 RepID=A0ACC2F3L5_DALPE|nr:hypothetical protein DPEC_G00345510 [Dallia pectoralis]